MHVVEAVLERWLGPKEKVAQVPAQESSPLAGEVAQSAEGDVP
mgnify:CR=1 FL=1